MGNLLAQVYNGGGIPAGVDATSGITGVSSADPRSVIVNIIATVLNYAALAAFVMVVIAGFYLVLSNGNEENKDKAKKIITYTLIGLVVLLFSRVIVHIFTIILPSII
jgi:VIT1/CCC1 family predicted Fe2+/Mn2+ transporter